MVGVLGGCRGPGMWSILGKFLMKAGAAGQVLSHVNSSLTVIIRNMQGAKPKVKPSV